MRCHICDKPSIGQCKSCWKFYCKDHGDVFCQKCSEGEAAEWHPAHGRWWVGNELTASTPVIMEAQAIGPDESAEQIRKALDEFPALKFKGEELLRVVPVVQEQTMGKTRLTIISLELYSDGFTMQYEVARIDAPADPRLAMMEPSYPEVHWEASDDTGAKYVGMNLDGGSTERGWRTREVFAPCVSVGASRLTLVSGEILWMAFGPGMRSRVEPGPWRFEIPLT